jgi:hypothetical protein
MKVIIPTDLSEITLGQLQALTKLEGSELNSIEMQKQTIELLTDVERATIDLFKLTDLNDVYGKLLSLSKRSDNLTQFVTIEGVKYGFHPNLSEISTGEFADLDTLCQDFNENLHLIMSILYRKVTIEKHGKYQIEPYDGDVEIRARLFKKQMPANVVNGALVFFWTIGSDYLSDSLSSLVEEQQTKSNKTSVSDGVGTLS